MAVETQQDLIHGLNDGQRSAVQQTDGPLLIIAGPGSGKTRVITHRIAFMIAKGIPSWQIVALTFTNKAADEMRNRLNKLSPGNLTWAGTFHRFCSRLLRQYAALVGLQENYTIYDMGDSKKVLKHAIANAEIDVKHFSADKIGNEISNLKNEGVSLEHFIPRPGNVMDKILSKVYPEYQKLLQMANAVDFDDLLLHCVDLLRDNPELRESLDLKFTYMMVDEYQDTNRAQYQLIRLLNHNVQNLAVTGDPDQSIYGWRGANISNILDFEKDYPSVSVVRLEENYRSTKSILRVADQLIENNVRRKKKSLITANDEGKPVRLVAYPSPQDEAADIADSIALAIQKGNRQAKDFAILYRTNWLSRAFEHTLRQCGVPYQVLNGHEFYQRKEIKDIIAYLHLLNNPNDSVAFERIVNIPSRKIGKVTLTRLQRYSRENSISMMEAARNCEQIETIKKAVGKRILAFVELMDGLSKEVDSEVEPVIRSVLASTNYREWLTDDGSEEAFERAGNVDELVVAAQEFDNEHPEDGGLARYLEQAALVSDTDVWESDANFVTMMTMHAAKGLEFPCVYVVGLEDGLLPHERSVGNDDEVEEERRLLFVGITRAEEELQFSRCLNRFRRGSYWPAIPSRFLMELPRDEMEIFGAQHQQAGMTADDLQRAIDSMDIVDAPDFSDLPAIDIHASDAAISVGGDMFGEKTVEPSGGEPAVKKPSMASMMTGAELAKQHQTNATADRLEPEACEVGIEVEHVEYGVGKVIAMTGTGRKLTATINFPKVGNKRICLAFSNLRLPS
jgi:DNA helicase-2/ATP-dependent DNA helicase PcrA